MPRHDRATVKLSRKQRKRRGRNRQSHFDKKKEKD